MTGYERKKPFWTTLPGILTGAAAVISAIGALIAVLYAVGILPLGTTDDVEPPKVTLAISVTDGGTTSPGPGSYHYDKDEQVTITASPDSGWEFDEWRGDYLGSSHSINITVGSDMSITAYFKEEIVTTIYEWWLLVPDPTERFFDYRLRAAVCLALSEESISEKASSVFNINVELRPKEELADGKSSKRRARELLAEAGYPDGFTAVAFVDPEDDEVLMFITQGMGNQLREVGIYLDFKFVASGLEDMVIKRINE